MSILSAYIFVKWFYAKTAGINCGDDNISKLQNRRNIAGIGKLFSDVKLFDIGFAIILLIFYTILTATLLLILHIPITYLSILIGILFTTITIYFISSKNIKKTVCVISVLAVILLICIGINTIIYDNTWDGEAYHKLSIGLMNNGWNPVYENSSQPIDKLDIESLIPSGSIIIDAYAKALWIFSACIYSLFGSIESGKCLVLMCMTALFCISYSLIIEKTKLKRWQAFICSFFLAANPVTLSQVFTYYVDAFLGLLVLIEVICILYLMYGDSHQYRLPAYALIFMTACIGINVKFSGFLLFGIFAAIFYIYTIIRSIKINGLKKSFGYIRNITIFFTVLMICSCCVFGSTTYIPNIINYGNPVYGIIGDTDIANIDGNMPVVLRNLPTELRFISSIFLESSNSFTLDTLNFKIPFTFTDSEFLAMAGSDCRMSGWGIMFSGLFIIGLICILITLIMSWKRDKNLFYITLLMSLGIIVPSTFIIGMWWARYNILPILIQIFALVFLFITVNRLNNSDIKNILSKRNVYRLCAVLCIMLVIMSSLINIAPGICKMPIELKQSISFSNDIDKLKTASDNSYLEVNTEFYGRLFNLIDNDINYHINQSMESPDGSIFKTYPISYVVDYKIIPLPAFYPE